MKHLVFPILLLLTLPACAPNHSDEAAPETGSVATDAEPMLTMAETTDNAYSHAPVQWQAALELAKEQYALVHQWLRREGLTGLGHADLVAAAETSEAASKYVDCHEASKSPTGYDGRLELLSSCLMRQADIGDPLDNTELTAGNDVMHSQTEIATLAGETR